MLTLKLFQKLLRNVDNSPVFSSQQLKEPIFHTKIISDLLSLEGSEPHPGKDSIIQVNRSSVHSRKYGKDAYQRRPLQGMYFRCLKIANSRYLGIGAGDVFSEA